MVAPASDLWYTGCMSEETTAPVEVDVEYDEIEMKMAKAQYYWELMGTQLLAESESDPAANEVESEVYAFIKARLATLMGTGTKKVGRKPAPTPALNLKPKPRVKQKRTLLGTVQNPAKPVSENLLPQGSTETDEYITVETVLADGASTSKAYRKMVDNESGKTYYLGYDSRNGTLVADGNKYKLDVDVTGNNIFRVISQQSLPPGILGVGSTKAGIEAASNAHATQTIQLIKQNLNSNPLLQSIVNTTLK